ncbi:hypothetical protein B0H16DRAFT_1476930 [Mycena metata]|uniref:Uncharacterized protein n=1 Tax=Mycena metata TaxID=1033252 RepID=A0AAD7HA82_9AGAR|nr:hypothetical protein B0H16DRAFT_1476930 [Mycena metata]
MDISTRLASEGAPVLNEKLLLRRTRAKSWSIRKKSSSDSRYRRICGATGVRLERSDLDSQHLIAAEALKSNFLDRYRNATMRGRPMTANIILAAVASGSGEARMESEPSGRAVFKEEVRTGRTNILGSFHSQRSQIQTAGTSDSDGSIDVSMFAGTLSIFMGQLSAFSTTSESHDPAFCPSPNCAGRVGREGGWLYPANTGE